MAPSPSLLPPASSGLRPTRLQMRIGFCGPSSRYSGAGVCVIVLSVYASVLELPITRSRGTPYSSS